MTGTSELRVSLLIVALAAWASACTIRGDPSLSNTRISLDQNGVNTTSTFSPSDKVYVVSELSNGAKGNVVASDCYAENVDEYNPDFIIDSFEYIVTNESYDGIVTLNLEPPDGGWAVGTYRVEVSFNGVPSATIRFSVQ